MKYVPQQARHTILPKIIIWQLIEANTKVSESAFYAFYAFYAFFEILCLGFLDNLGNRYVKTFPESVGATVPIWHQRES